MLRLRFIPLLVAASGAVFGAGTFLALVGACSGEPDVNYGNPGNLSKSNLPGEAGLEPLVCDAGAVVDGGPCPVSWKTDIYAKMIGTDAWQCATAACHAPANKQAPPIDPTNAAAALTALQGYKLTQSAKTLNYIDKSGDPSKSSIECNLGGACAPTMPEGSGKPLTQAEKCNLHIWLACGAPNN